MARGRRAVAGDGAPAMAVWDHLLEARRRLLVVLVAVTGNSFVAYTFVPRVTRAVHALLAEPFHALAITEGFLTRVRVALLLGCIATLPVLVVEVILFIAPALRERTRWAVVAGAVLSFALFAAGVVFCYRIVLPSSLAFLRSTPFYPAYVDRVISYGSFLGFFFQIILGFGIFFEFPVVIVALLTTGVVARSTLWHRFPLFVGGVFFLAALLTPPDLISQVLLALPAVFLYAITLLVARVVRVG